MSGTKWWLEMRVLVGQRKCRYEGEYAPEVALAHDVKFVEENPDFWETMVAEHQSSGEWAALSEITIKLDGNKVEGLLEQAIPELTGKIEHP